MDINQKEYRSDYHLFSIGACGGVGRYGMSGKVITRPEGIEDGVPVAHLMYQCFLYLDKEEALVRYRELHGGEPETIFWYQRLIWCGPLRQG